MKKDYIINISVNSIFFILLLIYFNKKINNLEENNDKEINYILAQVAEIQKKGISNYTPGIITKVNPINKIKESINNLGKSNVIKRYQAGIALQKYGKKSIPQLIEAIQSGNSRQAEGSSFLLTKMDLSKKDLSELRRLFVLLKPYKIKRAAGILTVLARHKDEFSKGIFRQELSSKNKYILAGAISGVCRIKDISSLPKLLKIINNPKITDSKNPKAFISSYLKKEITDALPLFCDSNSSQLIRVINNLSPRYKFLFINIISKNKSKGIMDVLRYLSHENDEKIALVSARLVALKGDSTAINTIKFLMHDTKDTKIKELGSKILNEVKNKAY